MNLALFDFDGTITHKDSFIRFIIFSKGYYKLIFGILVLSPILLAYKIKLIPNYVAKKIMFSFFFKGMKKDVFFKLTKDYSLNHLDKIVRLKAMEKINWHKKKSDKVVVVTASIENWLKPWGEKNSLEIIGTKIEIKDGLISGNFLTKNCYGTEKVNRIKKRFNLKNYKLIYAYGNSQGDKQMLNYADKKYYKYFKDYD